MGAIMIGGAIDGHSQSFIEVVSPEIITLDGSLVSFKLAKHPPAVVIVCGGRTKRTTGIILLDDNPPTERVVFYYKRTVLNNPIV